MCNVCVDFPQNCSSYEGPHSVECIVSARKLAGLSDEGCSHPKNLSDKDLQELQEVNIK